MKNYFPYDFTSKDTFYIASNLESVKNLTLIVLGLHKEEINEVLKSKSKSKTTSKSKSNKLGLKEKFFQNPLSATFNGDLGKFFHSFDEENNQPYIIVGLGDKAKISSEKLRQVLAQLYKILPEGSNLKFALCLDSFNFCKDLPKVSHLISETLLLTSYKFDKYLSEKKKRAPKEFYLVSQSTTANLEKGLKQGEIIASGVNFARTLINEVPNVLHSELFAKIIVDDIKEVLSKKNLSKFKLSGSNLKMGNIKVKVLTKKEIEKENMGLLLAVNQGSFYEPRVVHLTYEPHASQKRKESRHIALVGKGLTFDSGGYSLKPSSSINNMKTDMAGAATVYAAFRNAILLGTPHTISCFLGMTDNLVSSKAYLPDAVISGRGGKSVEIISTDAEGRLVLADIIDYACDFKPHVLIDAATLTGACVRALGHVVGLMANDEKLVKDIYEAAKSQDERIWELPIFDEYREDIKPSIADLRNTGNSSGAGAQKGGAFLEAFIKNGVKWAHLDIAGVNEVPHLHYCPKNSASGIMVRTLTKYLLWPLH